jgi:hypothetical protein
METRGEREALVALTDNEPTFAAADRHFDE